MHLLKNQININAVNIFSFFLATNKHAQILFTQAAILVVSKDIFFASDRDRLG